MNQLLQEKRDAENFLRLIAPKYKLVQKSRTNI